MGSFLGTGRSSCEGLQGLECCGVVDSRWCSARGAAERNRAVALGFWAAAVVVWCAREGHGVV